MLARCGFLVRGVTSENSIDLCGNNGRVLRGFCHGDRPTHRYVATPPGCIAGRSIRVSGEFVCQLYLGAPLMIAEIDAPELTFPEVEADWVRRHYADARVILEYGSGGSTVLAASNPECTVFSVESDRDWAANLEAYFRQNPPSGLVRQHPVDIGPTEKWGRPKGQGGWRKYHRYPISVWDREDFQHPDLVLIDGRFRAACWLTVLIRATKPVVVLFDDYVDRSAYHMVEDFVKPTEIRGRMARFDLSPQTFPVSHMARIFETFTRPL